MRRMHGEGYGQVIEAAEGMIPERVRRLVAPHYFCGSDPVFAGLHRFEDASFARSYRNTAHVAYAWHQTVGTRRDRATTVVLPTVPTLAVLVHELGHVLDEALDFAPDPKPVTRYAQVNRSEAFAEAFTSWLIPGYAQRPDDATLAVFDALSRG